MIFMMSKNKGKFCLVSVPVPLNIGSLQELQSEESGEPAMKKFRIQGQDGQSFVLTVAGNILYKFCYMSRDGENQRGFGPGHRSRLEARNFRFKKKSGCTIHVVKTEALISFAVTAKLICSFVFAYADCWFSHDIVHICTLVCH